MSKDYIIKIAEEIAERFNPDGLAPFPFDKIQNAIDNLNIFIASLESSMSGATVYDINRDDFKILVNKNKSDSRQYFTIAHELGHYFLHKKLLHDQKMIIDTDDAMNVTGGILYRLDGDSANNRIEAEANYFAATLIMPEKLVSKAWEITRDIQECARIFKVSVSAMSIRLEYLNLISSR